MLSVGLEWWVLYFITVCFWRPSSVQVHPLSRHHFSVRWHGMNISIFPIFSQCCGSEQRSLTHMTYSCYYYYFSKMIIVSSKMKIVDSSVDSSTWLSKQTNEQKHCEKEHFAMTIQCHLFVYWSPVRLVPEVKAGRCGIWKHQHYSYSKVIYKTSSWTRYIVFVLFVLSSGLASNMVQRRWPVVSHSIRPISATQSSIDTLNKK